MQASMTPNGRGHRTGCTGPESGPYQLFSLMAAHVNK